MTDYRLEIYSERFANLIVNRSKNRFRPHKTCMLLAVLDMGRSGALKKNQISFGPALLERYRTVFDAVRDIGEHPHPYYPFFALAGRLRGGEPSFWHLKAFPGKEQVLQNLDSPRRTVDVTGNVDYAWLDRDLHELIQDPAAVDWLMERLHREWAPRGFGPAFTVAQDIAGISAYERQLREGRSIDAGARPQYVRDPAFRRVVTEAYDYRCAASGSRLVLPNGVAMVEAAHIHPFSEGRDDDPRNGLALSPDMHWAMDRNLIAPGPDLRWHVNRRAKEFLDQDPQVTVGILQLQGKELLLPANKTLHPKLSSLKWRLDRLNIDVDW
jgi:putative restriction endonuclease